MAKRTASKADFIMSFPTGTPAKDIVEAGAAKGIKFGGNYVSRIRLLRRAKPKGAKVTVKATRVKAAKAKAPKVKAAKKIGRGPGRPQGPKNERGLTLGESISLATNVHAEREFKRLVLDLGLTRSRRLVDDVAAALAKIVG